MSARPIFLTGFMGSGKSSIGPRLAAALSCRFIDLDQQIVDEAGRSINEIFAVNGEPHFREMERRHLQQLPLDKCAVIATGGGAVIAAENRRFMRDHGMVINLNVTVEQVLSRLQGTTDRPLLAGDDAATRAAALLAEREPYYADADIRIDTNGKTVEDVLAEIIQTIKDCCL